MRLSHYFLPTLKENPAEAQIASHRLMLRAGMIHQVAAGIYAWLPLGHRVLRKIEQIVREEQDRAGSLEVLMPTIQPAELWQKSGRYEDYGKEMLRIQDRHERAMLFGPTAEEVITDIFQRTIKSYRDLPKRLYNIQWKFRDEVRPRFGVMRGREFLMKDNYSFDIDAAGARASYEAMFDAYLRTFRRMGVQAIPVKADTGPIGGDMSHEFHILAQTGESALYYDKRFRSLGDAPSLKACEEIYAAADDKHDPATCPLSPEHLEVARGIEVGHIFYFGTKYSVPLGAFVTTATGERVPVEMGSYGIGVSRLVGALIEAFHDDRGILWPESVAPFLVGLINLKPADTACTYTVETLYTQLLSHNVEVLLDDRPESPGVKFADMDLIGLPYQVIIGPQSQAQGTLEVKHRATGKIVHVSNAVVLEKALSGNLKMLF